MPQPNSVRSVLFVTPALNDNSTGRTYSLWLLARSLGWTADIISFHGDRVWSPLEGTDFAAACRSVPLPSQRARAAFLATEAQKYSVVVAVKPLPQSLGIALIARSKADFPLVVDIDDPDLELRLAWRPLVHAVLWRARYLRFWLSVRGPFKIAKRASVIVSNPVLQERHGGVLVPHSRTDTGQGEPHESSSPSIAFVGTPRGHKGIDVLRAAVEDLSGEGFTLTVTAVPPADAKPWENWIGNVPFESGLRLVAESDIVVIPSLRTDNAIGQLPVKLMDAMLLGRAVIVTDVDPLPWAVGRHGVVVPPNDSHALSTELRRLREPKTRSILGDNMRERGLEVFTVDQVAPAFRAACESSRLRSERPLPTHVTSR